MDLPAGLYIKIPPAARRTLLPGAARTPRGPDRPSMRRAPLASLVTALLLVCRAPLGATRLPDFDGHGESGLSLRLRLLPWGEERAPRWWPLAAPSASPPAPGAAGPDVAALVVRPLSRAGPAGGELRRRLAELSERLKRNQPPLSIDLTFHILRQMLEISRAQSQQEQAQQNRLLLDSLGK